MRLFKLAKSTGPQTYYDPKMRNILEDHLSILIAQANPTLIELPPGIANKYLGDLNGCLSAAGIAPEQWWVIGRMNGYINPTDYDGIKTTFLAPDITLLGRIMQQAKQRPVKSPNTPTGL